VVGVPLCHLPLSERMITMEKIRVQSGIEIEVNDAGETILVLAEDPNFADRFYGLAELFEKQKAEIEAPSLNALPERERLQVYIQKMETVKVEIDNVFGEGCCRKVFGNICPSPLLVADFLAQISPIIKKNTDERQKKILDKYTPGKNRNQQGKPYYKNHKKR